MMKSPFILKVTDDIELRQVEDHHVQEVFNLTDANRQHLREWLPWVDRTHSVTDTATFIASCAKQFEENRGFQAAIIFQDHLCGMVGHVGIDWLNRSTSLGYWLEASHQGQGIMTACCRAVIVHAFTELGLHRIEIRCATGNLRSRAIPERLVFSLEGVARQSQWLYDHFTDVAIYSLLSTDEMT